jgi:hypothetical protein
VLAYAAYAFLAGYALFLLGFAIFMYFENQKFGDNQFTMKLLPPPPRLAPDSRPGTAAVQVREAPGQDWVAVPGSSVSAAPDPGVPVRIASGSDQAGFR